MLNYRQMFTLIKQGITTAYGYYSAQSSYIKLSIVCTTAAVSFLGLRQIFPQRSKLVIDDNGYVDDVTKMNRTSVYKVIQPTSVADILEAINEARRLGKELSMFGQSHSMGKHIVAKDGIVLDTTRYDKVIAFDKINKTITVQPGITWAKIIHYVDAYGLSPMVLQSYATFSVGGTVSVNGHGITSDHVSADSVISLKLALSDGQIVECSRTKNPQLFSCVIGGYGLFGVITEITLQLVDNEQLDMTTNLLNPSSFVKEYKPLVDDPTIGIKLGRINVSNFDDITLFAFKKMIRENEISSGVPAKPHVASKPMQLMYNLMAGTYIGQRMRARCEKMLGRPLDWSLTCDTNGSLYESADPLATLWSPILHRDKKVTHVLQEYFIPADGKAFEDWVKSTGNYFRTQKFNNVALLNATIRFVKKDDTTLLHYAKEDMFAVVLYYRLDKLYEGDTELQEIHKHLTSLTLAHNGTFYLPYRHHYSHDDLLKAYPQWSAFVDLKRLYDPINLFSNEWWKAYSTTSSDPSIVSEPVDFSKTPDINEVPVDYQNVFTQQIATEFNKQRFMNFAMYVFNMANPQDTIGLLNGATEKDIYDKLANFVNSRSFMANISSSLGVLKTQKNELVSETINLLKKIGKTNIGGSYVAIGDCGRYVKGIKKGLHIAGPTYVVHDKQNFAQDSVERGSLMARGEFVNIDYDNVSPDFLQTLQDESAELVTLYIGLHHFTPDNLDRFLKEVKRVLKPNGVFILRDHNATEDIKPLLSFAHTYFNAMTGVSWDENQKEVRNFTTTKELREKLATYGLIDSGFYEKQLHDPTENFLMAFTPQTDIPPHIRSVLDQSNTYTRNKANGFHTVCEWASVDIFQTFGNSMDHTPFYAFPYFKLVSNFWNLFLTQTKQCVKQVGWKETFMADGILMNLMLGSLITIGFIPLGIFSAPLKWFYSNPKNADYTKQEVVLTSGDQPVDDNSFTNGRILNHWISTPGNYCYHVEFPRYKPFTAAMIELSQNPTISITEIGKQRTIQIKISYTGDTTIDAAMASLDGISVNAKQITSVSRMTPYDKTMVVLNVQVGDLLGLIREIVTKPNLKLEHVFDP